MTEEKKCSARVGPGWESTKSDLAFYIKNGDSADVFEENRRFPDKPETDDGYDDQADYEDDADAYRAEQETADQYDEIGDFHDYALAWDYVAPETFNDQAEGYWRYQISYGGPSTEIRFYASPGQRGYSMHRAEFWFLDWFDGAHVDITSTDEAQWLWEWFSDVGSVEHALEEATA